MAEERRKDDKLSERVAIVETQLGRLVSDAESEKDTRKRANSDVSSKLDGFDKRMRNIEEAIGSAKGAIWLASGIVGLIVFLINLWMKHS